MAEGVSVMGWSIGFDTKWGRDIGYGVPAYCDHPGCDEEIDRGLSYVCGGEPFGGEDGCGLYFCSRHLFLGGKKPQLCWHCCNGLGSYDKKPDHQTWIQHKLTDESWQQWRDENPEEVERMKNAMVNSQCPQCNSWEGFKFPREAKPYCEDCDNAS